MAAARALGSIAVVGALVTAGEAPAQGPKPYTCPPASTIPKLTFTTSRSPSAPLAPKWGHSPGAFGVRIDAFAGAEIRRGALHCRYDATLTNHETKMPRWYDIAPLAHTCLPSKGFSGMTCAGPTCTANCIPR